MEELRRHSGLVIFPYSAFAFLIIELYALNMPIFIPSVRLIIKHNIMHDRTVYDWCSKTVYRKMCDDIDAPDSPNSLHLEALHLWIGRSFMHRRKGCIVFDGADDLFAKLGQLATDREVITQKMKEENRYLDEEALKAWRKALETLELPLPDDYPTA